MDRPNVDGFITRMSANIVNPDGSAVPIQRLMLHHIVFFAIGQPNPTCTGAFNGYDSRPYPGGNYAAPIYGKWAEAGEQYHPRGAR